ncbi:hypothetical protein ACL6C3_14865 [Capilliphycus salinus ALCB114379]|uniref:hypothetical protein n=1 Tax=Capilliphycus salinus TaxID=2768948 RepID=UPI0039A71F16
MYKTQAPDTAPEAEQIQFSIWRKIPREQKTQQVHSFNRRMRAILWQNITQNFPHLDARSCKQKLIELEQGKEFGKIDALLENNFMLQDPIELAAVIGSLFEQLAIPYFVGGGLASSILGETRTTVDADIAILLNDINLLPRLIETMEGEFYLSEIAIEEALTGRTNTFNVIHLTSALKADIYLIRNSDEFRKTAMSRRQKIYPTGSPELSFYLCTAEDIVLQKLIWYQMTGRTSHKQWRDILGVLKLQAERLDFQYLQGWSQQLNVTQELQQALDEAGLTS